MEVTDLLRQVLKKHKISEAEVCRISGLKPSQLSRYLNQTQKKDIYVGTLLRIVKALPLKARSEFWWEINAMSLIEEDEETLMRTK